MSLSIQEFWRRWHISLSTWFKNYVYIPLGGNRKGKYRTIFNLFIVFLITGVWHGANITFIFWGLYHAFFNIIEKIFLGNLLKKNKAKLINWLYVCFVVIISWIFFRSKNLIEAKNYIKYMFAFNEGLHGFSVLRFINAKSFLAIIFGLIYCGPIQNVLLRFKNKKNVKITMAFCLVLLCISIVFIMNGSYSPSIYAKF